MDGPLILLVDDFEDALDIYSTYLTRCGYRVAVARNGVDAVDAAQRERPALVLMDLRMPLLDGASALQRIRQDATLAGLRVAAFTAHALDDERRRALHAGFDVVISKPCLPDELAAIVARLIAEPR